ncbi:hypothetical protein HRbin09_00259 [bacterium HR09]|nr:hypothetical protein HRbin09_00259 [bacterium HR09]
MGYVLPLLDGVRNEGKARELPNHINAGHRAFKVAIKHRDVFTTLEIAKSDLDSSHWASLGAEAVANAAQAIDDPGCPADNP